MVKIMITMDLRMILMAGVLTMGVKGESMTLGLSLQTMLMELMLQERLVQKEIIKVASLVLPGKPRLCQLTLELNV